MIDWKNCKTKDFSVSFISEDIDAVGDTVVIPVDVYYKEDEFAFRKSVAIKAEYYFQLREKQGWMEHLKVVLKTRIKDEIVQRINSEKVPIDDKMNLFNEEKEHL